MTEKDLAQIETKLKIALPKQYRNLVLARSTELNEAGCFNDDFSPFYLEPKEFINANTLERPKDSGTGYAFPRWWETFVLIGTNGGGDYYCLRLDSKPGVWMIGSDCGDKPTRVARTLKAFVEERISNHKEEQEREAKRREALGEEGVEELKLIAETPNPKAESWLTAQSPYPMFNVYDSLGTKISPRKLRLFGIACCRRIPNIAEYEICTHLLQLAERTASGMAAPEESVVMRDRIRASFENRQPSQVEVWAIRAIRNLFQDDRDYLGDAPIHLGDPDLLSVWNVVASAGIEHSELADLLREVIGNPFLPVQFEEQWRTTAVVKLAHKIYDEEAFDQMPALADVLEKAGCDNQRILKHCRRKANHVRGCWVLDLVLKSDPDPKEEEFTWDFKWEHPKIDANELKRRLQDFGTDAGRGDRVTPATAREFADWLEKNGDSTWAQYIRVRLALDRKAPADDYPDLVEQCFELAAAMNVGQAFFEGFYFSGFRFAEDEWWEDKTDDMEWGLPSQVNAVPPGKGAGPVSQLIQRVDAFIRATPLRGIDFEWNYADEMSEILRSPSARHFRWLEFTNRPHETGKTGPVIEALVKSPVAQTLERLSIGEGLKSDADVLALAEASFKRLRRLDFPYGGIACSAKAVTRLISASWFRQLEHLQLGFSDECCETGMRQLAGLPKLHSLAMSHVPDRQIQAISQAKSFPALRRLVISGANLTGENSVAFSKLKAPQLEDLWLWNSTAKTGDIHTLTASPLFDKIRVLTLHGPRLNEAGLDALAGSACAPELRILRLNFSDSNLEGTCRTLAGSALTKPGVFPQLTTLHIRYPYAKNVKKRDIAKFLETLATPNLRHLILDECDFDGEAAKALSNSPTFVNLTRLKIDQGYKAKTLLSPQAAQRLFRSTNLQNLIELHFDNFELGQTLEILADESVLPKLANARFYSSRAPRETIEQLRARRPVVYIGS